LDILPATAGRHFTFKKPFEPSKPFEPNGKILDVKNDDKHSDIFLLFVKIDMGFEGKY